VLGRLGGITGGKIRSERLRSDVENAVHAVKLMDVFQPVIREALPSIQRNDCEGDSCMLPSRRTARLVLLATY
jgi:hypothetical protein